ncbi:LLM class flavin-dependent oxidoreductase [Kribbella sp. NPDC050820]|uniref:LLM class flavin-dependent oxidoreductase n=1 Tax=Kribbella sp. NPDC050820 TaxID=3155408 RepID=UPI0033F67CD7
MEFGVHLPLMEFGGEAVSLAGLQATVDAARDGGFTTVSANDHFLFSTPWLDGPTALAAVLDRSGDLTLATTISLLSLRGPVPLAKTLVALDVLSGGRVIAGVGPGSSRRDYDAVGMSFEDRWSRFEEAVTILRALLGRGPMPEKTRYYAVPDGELQPLPVKDGGIPVWIGSWGSPAGLRRVARLADGWLASAYNTSPEQFATAQQQLADIPNALVTMWTWITEDRSERERVLHDVLAPLLKRDPDDLRDRVCVGPAGHCADLLSRYAQANCHRAHLWPLGDPPRQLDLFANQVAPRI